MGTAFTYQGFLEKPAGSPVTDACIFEFSLWDDPFSILQAINQIGPTLVFGELPPFVLVTGGVFTVDLDFGANSINGTARWLDIKVCCPNVPPCTPTPLTPRVELTPAPHALALPGVATRQDTQQVLITAPGGVGIGTNEPNAALDVNGRTIIRGREPVPTTGTGMELGYNPAMELGFIQVLDRDTLAWKDLYLGQSNIRWSESSLNTDQLGSIELGPETRSAGGERKSVV